MFTHEEALVSALRAGRPLSEVGLQELNGRFLVKGVRLPALRKIGEFKFGKWEVQELTGKLSIDKVSIEHVYFLNCDLGNLGFYGCNIVDCVFQDCSCRKMGFWESTITDCSLLSCDLRRVALGGIDALHPRNPNAFLRVVFEKCDLRETGYFCESYKFCEFRNCAFKSIDTLGAVFENCVFQGKIEDVTFRAYTDAKSRMPRNRLLGCDFRNADLVDTQFLHLDLDPACFPQDGDVIVLPRGPKDLMAWQNRLGRKDSYIANYIEVSGTPSIQSRRLLLSIYTEEEVSWLDAIVKKSL